MDSMNYHVSIKALVFDPHEHLLLVQEDSGVWDLPGGRMEHGESFHEALLRECREEMGVSGRILDTTPFLAWSTQHSDGFWKAILCFRMHLPTQELLAQWTPSSECRKLGFFSPDALPNLNLVQQMKPLAQHWRAALAA
jgi:8-oxo-dGTP pyrophosphatase MutT (NUDIX family)